MLFANLNDLAETNTHGTNHSNKTPKLPQWNDLESHIFDIRPIRKGMRITKVSFIKSSPDWIRPRVT